MLIFVTTVLVLMACGLLLPALMLLVTRRPLFLNGRHLFAFQVLGYSTLVATPLSLLSKDIPVIYVIVIVLNTILYGWLLTVSWKLTAGYHAIGVQRESFREALRHALNEQRLPLRDGISDAETSPGNAPSKIDLPVQMGIADIKSIDSVVLRRLVQDMKTFCRTHSVAANKSTVVYLLTVGTFLLIAAGVCAYIAV